MDIVISDSDDVAKPFIERINVVQGDIAEQDVGAIATVLPRNLDFSGGINGSIAKAAGYDVDGFILENIYKPKPMEVYALPGGNLPARTLLVGIMPYYRAEFDRQERDLCNVVRRIMELARCMLITKIAFPPLASGRKVFPKRKAARLIVQGITDRMHDSIEEVRLVCPDEETYCIYEDRLSSLEFQG